MAESQYLYVKGNRDDGRVAISEVDDAHPGGSIFVAHRMTRKAAKTAFVMEKLRGVHPDLVETDDADDIKEADEFLGNLMELEAADARAAGVVSERYGDMNLQELAVEAKSRDMKFPRGTTRKTVIQALEADDAKRAEVSQPPVQPEVPNSGEDEPETDK